MASRYNERVTFGEREGVRALAGLVEAPWEPRRQNGQATACITRRDSPYHGSILPITGRRRTVLGLSAGNHRLNKQTCGGAAIDDQRIQVDPLSTTSNRAWFVYIVRCSDGSLYTGISTDVSRRCEEHNAGTASHYTRSRLPVVVIYQEAQANRSLALKREYAIKTLTRLEKESLIRTAESGTANTLPRPVL